MDHLDLVIPFNDGERARPWCRWSAQEHARLEELVTANGPTRSWSSIAAMLGTGRTGKQCRERWLNHASDACKKGSWSHEEEFILATQYAEHGSQWARICRHLPGRSDNSVKNHWNATWRSKQLMHKPQSILSLFCANLKVGMPAQSSLRIALLKWERNVPSTQVMETLGFWPSEKFAEFTAEDAAVLAAAAAAAKVAIPNVAPHTAVPPSQRPSVGVRAAAQSLSNSSLNPTQVMNVGPANSNMLPHAALPLPVLPVPEAMHTSASSAQHTCTNVQQILGLSNGAVQSFGAQTVAMAQPITPTSMSHMHSAHHAASATATVSVPMQTVSALDNLSVSANPNASDGINAGSSMFMNTVPVSANPNISDVVNAGSGMFMNNLSVSGNRNASDIITAGSSMLMYTTCAPESGSIGSLQSNGFITLPERATLISSIAPTEHGVLNNTGSNSNNGGVMQTLPQGTYTVYAILPQNTQAPMMSSGSNTGVPMLNSVQNVQTCTQPTYVIQANNGLQYNMTAPIMM